MTPTLEICVDDPVSLEAAVAGGADRIELCSALELGGLTPSPAFLARAVATGVPVHAMIRPRAGDFIYAHSEIAVMLKDIRDALAAGAAGVVVGAARGDGRLDRESLGRFRDAASGGAMVLHRVVDLTPDPVEAVEQACALGVDKILSSGGATHAAEGIPVLKRMVEAAAARLSVIAGAGISPANAAQIARATGVHELHGSASQQPAPPDPQLMRFGFASAPRRRTDAETVRQLRRALDEMDGNRRP